MCNIFNGVIIYLPNSRSDFKIYEDEESRRDCSAKMEILDAIKIIQSSHYGINF